jgi:hypothetical protein
VIFKSQRQLSFEIENSLYQGRLTTTFQHSKPSLEKKKKKKNQLKFPQTKITATIKINSQLDLPNQYPIKAENCRIRKQRDMTTLPCLIDTVVDL